MPRWRQVVNKQTGKSDFVPLDADAAKRDGHFIHGDIESFVSPIDGTVISDRKQYDEHCKRHGVVPSAEFPPEYYQQKAEERRKHYEGEVSRQEQQRRRENIHEIMNHMERRNGH